MNQGGQSMKVNVNEVIVDKLADLATVTLYQFCVTGKHFKTAKLTCRKNNGDEKVEYLVLDMEDVMVSAVSFAGAGEEVQVTDASFLPPFLTQELQSASQKRVPSARMTSAVRQESLIYCVPQKPVMPKVKG